MATETFSSIKTVKSFANEDGETERYSKQMEETYALNRKEAASYAASTWTTSVSWMTFLALTEATTWSKFPLGGVLLGIFCHVY